MLVRIVERISQIAIWTCWAVECWQIGQVGWWLRCIFRHLYLNLFNHFTLILFSLPFSHRVTLRLMAVRNPKDLLLNPSASREHFSQFTFHAKSIELYLQRKLLARYKAYSICWQVAPGLQGKCEMFKVTATVSIDYNKIEISLANHVAIWFHFDLIRLEPATLFHVSLLLIHSSHLIGRTCEWTLINLATSSVRS